MSSKDKFENVSFGSEIDEELQDILRDSYLDPEFESKWSPAKIEIIRNQNLLKQFEEKKQEFFVHGHKADEMEEKFGFLVENNVARLEALGDFSFHTEDSEYNALGYNCMGVYLCRFVDVCLQHALVKFCGSNVIRLVICKYLSGRQTTAIPRVASAAEFIEPTQGFDSHVSVIHPSPTDSLQNQFDRSQVYLYEINKLLQPASCPRHILPYAVITYTPDGAYNSAIDAEPTGAEKLASNPQLQLIIKQINARGGDIPLEASSAAAASLASSCGGKPTLGANSRPVTTAAPSQMLASGQYGLSGKAIVVETSDPTKNSESAKLQRVISELNAKLGAEDMKKFAFGDLGGKGVSAASMASQLSHDYGRSTMSGGVGGSLMQSLGVLPGSGLQFNFHAAAAAAAVSSAAGWPPSASGQAALSAYGLLKPGLQGMMTSQHQAMAGFFPGGQQPLMSRGFGMTDPTTGAMTSVAASYFSIPSAAAASFFPQNAVYPFDYMPTVLGGGGKDSAAAISAAAAAGFYPIQAINPASAAAAAAAGYAAMVGQGVKRPLAGDYVPYAVDKRQKFF